MRAPLLELDHVAPRRRRRWPGMAMLVVSLAIAGDLVLRYRDAQSRLERLPPAAASAPRPARVAPSKTADAEAKLAKAALHQLTLPWGGLVRALESASQPDVALLQLQPEAQQELLRITAEARDPAAMFRYLRTLGAAKGFSEVHLLNHEVVQDDPQRPVRFSAQASFRSMR